MKFEITTLGKGWHDQDEILLHACFQCLVNFVEKEDGLNHCNYEAHKASVDECRELYDWWKSENRNNQHPDFLVEECDKQLKRLIEIYHFMWT